MVTAMIEATLLSLAESRPVKIAEVLGAAQQPPLPDPLFQVGEGKRTAIQEGVMSVLDLFRLDGKRAVVTGASRGLGRSMALALADVGADVVITGRTQATLDTTAAEIRALGRQAWTVKADMGVPAQCEAACEQICELGPIDILINNSATAKSASQSRRRRSTTWRAMIDLNLTSCFSAPGLSVRRCWRAATVGGSSISLRSAR